MKGHTPKKGYHSAAKAMQSSGKLVILGILGVAVASAAVSWWFRYSATHWAAQFWGPETVRLIRDAPLVQFIELRRATASDGHDPMHDKFGFGGNQHFQVVSRRDISHAPGLLHLRNALLEDRSYAEAANYDLRSIDWRWGLSFVGPGTGPQRTIWFSDDCRLALQQGVGREPDRVVAVEPIAAGLSTMFTELSAEALPR
jgi:hypothetical protein